MVTNDESTRYMTNLQSPQIYQSGSGGGRALFVTPYYIFLFSSFPRMLPGYIIYLTFEVH